MLPQTVGGLIASVLMFFWAFAVLVTPRHSVVPGPHNPVTRAKLVHGGPLEE